MFLLCGKGFMKEFLKLLKNLNFKALFKEKTDNGFIQFFRYIFVGGVATIVDWTILELLYLVHHDTLGLSVAMGFTCGLIVNLILSKFFVFKGTPSKNHLLIDVLIYIIIGVIGLVLTEIIMWLITIRWGVHHIIAKAISTVLVLVWNFGAKKIILYRKRIKK